MTTKGTKYDVNYCNLPDQEGSLDEKRFIEELLEAEEPATRDQWIRSYASDLALGPSKDPEKWDTSTPTPKRLAPYIARATTRVDRAIKEGWLIEAAK